MMADRTMLAKIHIAKKELGLTDEAYRDILRLHFDGAESAKELNDRQLTVLLNKFKARGWKQRQPTTVKKGRSGTKKVSDNYRKISTGPYAKMQRKVLALWATLGYDVSLLDARCKKQFGVERIEWVQDYDHLRVLILDLTSRCESAGV